MEQGAMNGGQEGATTRTADAAASQEAASGEAASEAETRAAPAAEADGPDARFEDAFKPARLVARDDADLPVLSALLQDAVVKPADLAFISNRRRFALLLNRFRWERPDLKERVRAGLHFDGVLSVRSKGIDRGSAARPLSLLAVAFEPADASAAPAGQVRLTFAGDAEIELAVEALDAVLTDLSKPWPAAATPAHFA